MAVSGGARCIKLLLALFTFLFLVSGILLLSLGVRFVLKEEPFATLLPSFPFLTAANLFIAIGAIVFIVSFIGFCGALRESKTCLSVFGLLLAVIFILELAAGILAFVYRGQVEKYVTDDLTKEGLNKYDMDGQKGLTLAWDSLQEQLKCCGVNNKTDWGHYAEGFNGTDTTPDSCCVTVKKDCGQELNAKKWENGCKESLISEIEANVNTLCVIGIVIAVFEILGICLAFSLCTRVGDDKRGQYA